MRGLAERYPDNSAWQRDLSVSLNKVGDVKLQRDDAAGADAAYAEGLKIVARLAERNPENLGLIRDVALSLSNLGDVRLRTGDASGAVAHYEQALAKLRPLSEHDPDNTLWLRDMTRHDEQTGRRQIADRGYRALRQRATINRWRSPATSQSATPPISSGSGTSGSR